MFTRILVPIDGSDTAWAALNKAIELAKDQHAALRIIEIVDLGPLFRASISGANLADIEKAIIQDCKRDLARADALARSAGLTPETALIEGSGRRISSDIIDEAERWSADLIVMGTHGRHGIERFVLGSVAEGVARSAPVPVMLIKSS